MRFKGAPNRRGTLKLAPLERPGTPLDTPCRGSWAPKGPQKSLLFTLKNNWFSYCPSGAVLPTFGIQHGVPFAAEILPGRKKLPVRK